MKAPEGSALELLVNWLASQAPQKKPGHIQEPGLMEPTALSMESLPPGARITDYGITDANWNLLPVQRQSPVQILGDIGKSMLRTSGGVVAPPAGGTSIGSGAILPAHLTDEALLSKVNALKSVESPAGKSMDFDALMKNIDQAFAGLTKELQVKNAELKAPPKPQELPVSLEQKPFTATDQLKSKGWTDAELKPFTPEEHAKLYKNLYEAPDPSAFGPPLDTTGYTPVDYNTFAGQGVQESQFPKRLIDPEQFVGPPVPDRSLPLDTASRLQRAADMGFNLEEPLYTGMPLWGEKQPLAFKDPQASGTKFGEDAVFLSKNPQVAENYNQTFGAIAPVYARAENPLTLDWKKINYGDIDYNNTTMSKAIAQAKAGGHDILTLKGMRDLGGVQDQVLALEPNRLRSMFAKFDPKNIDANDLMASLAVAFGLPAATQLLPGDKK